MLARSGRDAVATAIVTSRESATRQLNLIYLAMLGRYADAAALASRLPVRPDRGVFTVPVSIAGSGEFFNYTQR